MSASEAKLSTFDCFDVPEPEFHGSTGNRIINSQALMEIISILCCSKCYANGLKLVKDSKEGLCSNLCVTCSCGFMTGFTSTPKENKKFSFNTLLVYGLRLVGRGFTAESNSMRKNLMKGKYNRQLVSSTLNLQHSQMISTGRPRNTTPNEDRYLAVTNKRNRRSTASNQSRQLSSGINALVSRQTVYRRLGHIGLYARRPVRCVPLTATHCHLRLTWSREHALWTPQQWYCVMFSDESRFSLQSDSLRTLIWRAPGTRYHQEKPLNDTVTVVQDGSIGEELFLVPKLTCMFRV
ncbi:HTH_Tnp_Tc3_2 domain-containing protein [Trichonephila clavipes]|nr:HTH_Tnp_Tc3_2 domain-containing protein [Trichonephila clavipes]